MCIQTLRETTSEMSPNEKEQRALHSLTSLSRSWRTEVHHLVDALGQRYHFDSAEALAWAAREGPAFHQAQRDGPPRPRERAAQGRGALRDPLDQAPQPTSFGQY